MTKGAAVFPAGGGLTQSLPRRCTSIGSDRERTPARAVGGGRGVPRRARARLGADRKRVARPPHGPPRPRPCTSSPRRPARRRLPGVSARSDARVPAAAPLALAPERWWELSEQPGAAPPTRHRSVPGVGTSVSTCQPTVADREQVGGPGAAPCDSRTDSAAHGAGAPGAGRLAPVRSVGGAGRDRLLRRCSLLAASRTCGCDDSPPDTAGWDPGAARVARRSLDSTRPPTRCVPRRAARATARTLPAQAHIGRMIGADGATSFGSRAFPPATGNL